METPEVEPEVELFRMSPEGKAVALKKGTVQTVSASAIGIALALGVLVGVAPQGMALNHLLGVLVVSILVVGLVVVRDVRRQIATRLEGTAIALGSEVIRSVSPGLRPMELTRVEVTKIEESSQGSVLRGADKRHFVFVPVGLEQLNRVRSKLETWRSIEQGRLTDLKLALGYSAGFVGSWFLAAVAPVRVLTLPGMILFITLLAFGIRQVLRERYFHAATKRRVVAGAIFFSLPVLGRLLLLFRGAP